MKLEALRMDNGVDEKEEGGLVDEQHGPQLDGGGNAAQPEQRRVGQQLHQQILDDGAAAPQKMEHIKYKEAETPAWCKKRDNNKELG